MICKTPPILETLWLYHLAAEILSTWKNIRGKPPGNHTMIIISFPANYNVYSFLHFSSVKIIRQGCLKGNICSVRATEKWKHFSDDTWDDVTLMEIMFWVRFNLFLQVSALHPASIQYVNGGGASHLQSGRVRPFGRVSLGRQIILTRGNPWSKMRLLICPQGQGLEKS